jgi:hypothetical protein
MAIRPFAAAADAPSRRCRFGIRTPFAIETNTAHLAMKIM